MSNNPINKLEEMFNVIKDDVNINIEHTNIDYSSILDVYIDLFLNMASKVNNEIILKGNVLLNKLLPDTARGTVDMDLSVLNTSVYDDIIVPEFKKFGDSLVYIGKAESYNIHPIKVRSSGGIDAFDKDNNILFAVDVRLMSTSVYGYLKYNFGGIYAYGSSIEKILCDKCLSTLSKRKFKRIKDFYDIFIILDSDVEYDIEIVYKLMLELIPKEELNHLLSNLKFAQSDISNLKQLWKSYVFTSFNKSNEISKPEFNIIFNNVYSLYAELSNVYNKEVR